MCRSGTEKENRIRFRRRFLKQLPLYGIPFAGFEEHPGCHRQYRACIGWIFHMERRQTNETSV